MAKRRDNFNKKLNNLKKNSVVTSKDTRSRVIRVDNAGSLDRAINNTKKEVKSRFNIKSALSDYRKRNVSEIKSTSAYLKEQANVTRQALGVTVKTGNTIADAHAYKQGLAASDMGGGDDFDDMYSESGGSGEDDFDTGDMDFDMMGDSGSSGEDSAEFSNPSVVVNNNSGTQTAVQLTSGIVSSLDNLINVNAEGFNSVSESIGRLAEGIGGTVEGSISSYRDLIEVMNEIRVSASTTNITSIRNTTALEDIITGEVTVGGMIGLLTTDTDDNKGIFEKAKDTIVQEISSMMKSNKPGAVKKGMSISDIPMVSNVLLKGYDKLGNWDTSKLGGTISEKIKIPGSEKGLVGADTASNMLDGLRNKLLGTGLFSWLGGDGRLDTKSKVSMGSKVAFDAETHNSINTVIPGYLARLVSAVTGKKQQHFNYNTGKWETAEDIRQGHSTHLDKAITDSSLYKSIQSKLGNESLSKELTEFLADNQISNDVKLYQHMETLSSKFGRDILEKIGMEDNDLYREVRKSRLNIIKANKDYNDNLSGSMKNVFNDESMITPLLRPSSISPNSSTYTVGDVNIDLDSSNINTMNGLLSDIRDKMKLIADLDFSVASTSENQASPVKEKRNIKEEIEEKFKSNEHLYGEDSLYNKGKRKVETLRESLVEKFKTDGPEQKEKFQNSIKEVYEKYAKKSSNEGVATVVPPEDENMIELNDSPTMVETTEESQGGSIGSDIKDYIKDEAQDKLKEKLMDNLTPDKMKELIKNKKFRIPDKVKSSPMIGKMSKFFSNNSKVQAMTKGGSRLGLGAAASGAGAAAKAGRLGAFGKGLSKVLKKVPYIGPILTAAGIATSLGGGKDEPTGEEKLEGAMAQASVSSTVSDKVQDIKLKLGAKKDSEEKAILRDNKGKLSEMSEGAKRVIGNNKTLLKVAGGTLVAHQLYERVLAPTLGAGTNIMHKILGVSSAFGAEADIATEERGGLLSKIFKGILTGIGTVVALGITAVTSVATLIMKPLLSIMNGVTNGILGGGKWLLDKISGAETAGAELSDASDGITEKTDESIAEIAKSGDMVQETLFDGGGAAEEAEELMNESTNQVKQHAESSTGVFKTAFKTAIENSPMGLMYKVSKKFSSLFKGMPKDVQNSMDSDMKTGSDNSTLKGIMGTLIKLSPLYHVYSSSKRLKDKISGKPPQSKVETTIAKWFDKIGAILQHSGNALSTSTASAATTSGSSSGDDTDTGGSNTSGAISKMGAQGISYNPKALNLQWSHSFNRSGVGYMAPKYVQITGVAKHYGVDFKYDVGDPVKSPASGKVIYASGSGWNNGFGGIVIMTTGAHTLLFSHLSAVRVKVGQQVSPGTLLGLGGNTGASTGPHLHFQVMTGTLNPGQAMANQNTIDPEKWLAMANGGSPVKIKDFNSAGSSATTSSLAGMSNVPDSDPSPTTVDMGPLDFNKVDWRGTITGRDKPYATRTKEEGDAQVKRLTEKWAKEFGYSMKDIEESAKILNGEKSSSENSKGESGSTGVTIPGKGGSSTGTSGSNGKGPGSSGSGSSNGQLGSTGKGPGSTTGKPSVVNNINNYYDYSTKNVTINNIVNPPSMKTIPGKDGTVITLPTIPGNNSGKPSTGGNSGVDISNPLEFDKRIIEDLKEITKHAQNIANNTYSLADNMALLKDRIKDLMIEMSKKNAIDVNDPESINHLVNIIIDKIKQDGGIPTSPETDNKRPPKPKYELEEELRNELMNEFVLDPRLMDPILQGM